MLSTLKNNIKLFKSPKQTSKEQKKYQIIFVKFNACFETLTIYLSLFGFIDYLLFNAR